MRPIEELLQILASLDIRLWLEDDSLRYSAPEGVMTTELLAELRTHKTQLTAFLRKSEALPTIEINEAERDEPFPLTDVQHAYWLGRQNLFELGNVATHGYAEYDCTDLDLDALSQAWQILVERHEMLRMVVTPDGQQKILLSTPLYTIQELDLTSYSEEEQERQLLAIREEMSHQVFDPEKWPLFEFRASCIDTRRTRLHLSIEYLLVDAASISRLFTEWKQLYADPSTQLKPLELSFRDYMLAKVRIEEGNLYKASTDYWINRLTTLPPAPELPFTKNFGDVTTPVFSHYPYRLEAEKWQQIKMRAQLHGLSPTEILLTTFSLALGQWSKSSSFTLNMTIFNRLPIHPQVNEIVGDFTDLNLLEIHTAQSQSLIEFGKSIQQQLRQDLDHQYFNGIRVMRALSNHNNEGRALMPVVFTSTLGVEHEDHADSVLFDMPDYSISQTSQAWLDHQISEVRGALTFNWDVIEELFPADLLRNMFDAYCGLLQRLATDEAVWHDKCISLLPQYQRDQRMAVNATNTSISTEMLHTLFLQKVADRATEPAVITSSQTLSYQEVYERANHVGHWLRSQGAKPNQLVAVVMEKGWEQVVAVLGIHLSGAAYLPIDPNLPTERRNFLLTEGDVTSILTQTRLDDALAWPGEMPRLRIDTVTPDATLPPLDIVQTPTDLAYVIYTSGSTGRPKGVVIDHRGAVNTVLDVTQRYGVTASDRVLALSALNFDLSVYDIFGLLAAGGAIVMPDPILRIDPEHWTDLIGKHEVTVWNTVPALMQMLVEYEEIQGGKMAKWQNGKVTAGNGHPATQQPCNLATLRLVMMSGDWIPVTLPDRIRALYPDTSIYSMGGATEASIWSIDYPIEKVDPSWTSIPYGKPMVNQTFHVLDANLNPRPIWVPGDLYIGGIGVALGYWKDEERTNASFITHPKTGERLYKTGDLGRYLPDGNIEFLGREDFQIKIRGHRIELGEIESTLLQHPSIDEVVVNAAGDPKGHRQLVAYIVGNENLKLDNKDSETMWMQDDGHKHTKSWKNDLQDYLATKLPSYMIPSFYIDLEALPLTTNGKINRQALPIPNLNQEQEEFVAPDSDLEKQICAILSDLAEVSEVSITQEFAELGLNSVHLVQTANRLRRELDAQIPLEALFQYTTAQALATYLTQPNGQMATLKEEQTVAKTRQKSRAQARLAQRRRQR
ncbi:MAG: amino acid adenylation domain-containing protein [Chloroflexota bacterium]